MIGDNIKQARIKHHMTLEEVAKQIGTSRQTIHRYETGVISNIPSDKIEAIARVLDTSPAALMGWEDYPEDRFPAPRISEDNVTFPVIGEIAAGYDSIALENWVGETVEVPAVFLHGRPAAEFIVLQVKGDSMFPTYQDGDLVLILKQNTLDHSGQIGAVLYDDELATLKRVEYVPGEDWMRLLPINPAVPPTLIVGERLEHCRILGVPWLLVRKLKQ